jgi:hypothetical protein
MYVCIGHKPPSLSHTYAHTHIRKNTHSYTLTRMHTVPLSCLVEEAGVGARRRAVHVVLPAQVLQQLIGLCGTHIHTHTQRERDRANIRTVGERERAVYRRAGVGVRTRT